MPFYLVGGRRGGGAGAGLGWDTGIFLRAKDLPHKRKGLIFKETKEILEGNSFLKELTLVWKATKNEKGGAAQSWKCTYYHPS